MLEAVSVPKAAPTRPPQDNCKESYFEMNLSALKSIGVLKRLRRVISAMTRVSRISTHVSEPDLQLDVTIDCVDTVDMRKPERHSIGSTVQLDIRNYMSAFLCWILHSHNGGEKTGEEVEMLARKFEKFAKVASINKDALFKGLAGAGIKPRVVDLKPGDPGYAEKLSSGIKRPRIRVYSLPASEISEPSRSRETAPRQQNPLFVLGGL